MDITARPLSPKRVRHRPRNRSPWFPALSRHGAGRPPEEPPQLPAGPCSWAGRSRCFSLALVTCFVSPSWANAEVSEDPVPAHDTLAAKRGWPLPSAFPRQTTEPRSGERPGREAWLCAGCAGTRPGKPCVRGGPVGSKADLSPSTHTHTRVYMYAAAAAKSL